MDPAKHLELLGYKVQDLVTGFEGVVTSIAFDLNGCTQALVTPRAFDKDESMSKWFYVCRLEKTSSLRVVASPAFWASDVISQGMKEQAENLQVKWEIFMLSIRGMAYAKTLLPEFNTPKSAARFEMSTIMERECDRYRFTWEGGAVHIDITHQEIYDKLGKWPYMFEQSVINKLVSRYRLMVGCGAMVSSRHWRKGQFDSAWVADCLVAKGDGFDSR